ncbi:MAG: hypothetical protein Q9195_009472 [Heterodermia aff. obscurata]
MSKAKAITPATGPADSDMDDELDSPEANAQPSPDSNQENNAAPGKRGRPSRKAASARFSKPKAPAKRTTSATMVEKKKAAPKKRAVGKRVPLKEQANVQQASDTEVGAVNAPADKELDPIEDVSMDEQPPVEEPPKSKKPVGRGKKTATKESKPPPKTTEKDGEFEYTPIRNADNAMFSKVQANANDPVGQNSKKNKNGKPTEIPETQTEPMDIDPPSVPEKDEDAIPQSVYRQTNNLRATSKTRQPPVNRRRAGSASDTEPTATDPALRRKLGEMTKKVDNLERRYSKLREVGIKEAEANFEKLKAQSEAKTRVANDLIASLRKELVEQKALVSESKFLSQQITTKDNDLATANAKIALLNTSLTESQNENKALQAKLANVRASSVVESVQTGKTPGSAMKGKPQARTIMVGSAEAAQAAQVAQLKEDLYSDLTGLILRGVEKEEEESVYDCIQTGRNGTLHFKISVANDTDVPYDEADIKYTPLLDANRDRDILQLLPDYLSEEITFPRSQAAHFYGRVVDTLMKKQRMASEDE